MRKLVILLAATMLTAIATPVLACDGHDEVSEAPQEKTVTATAKKDAPAAKKTLKKAVKKKATAKAAEPKADKTTNS